MTFLTLVILALAVYRLTHLIVFDKLFERVRKHFVTRSFDGQNITFTLQGGPARRFIGKIMNCYWCAGIWVSAFVVSGHLLSPIITFYISFIFALASVQALTETRLLKSVGMPLEMVEVPKELEEDPLRSARGIKNAIIISLVFYIVAFSIGLILLR